MGCLENQLLVGDARDELRAIGDEAVQLTITSPPYNLDKNYGDRSDDCRSVEKWRSLMQNVADELFRVTKPDGKVCVNVAASFDSGDDGRYRRIPLRRHVIDVCRDAGFDFIDEFVWIKRQYSTHGEGALLGSYPYPSNIPVNQRHEYILVFRKYVSEEYCSRSDLPAIGTERREASKLTSDEWREYAQSVWELSRANPDVDAEHPAPFPLELPRRLIAFYSFAGDNVLDPFVGIGTTAVAAAQTGRNYIGIDRNEAYIETARRRLDAAEDQNSNSDSDAEPSPPDEVAQYILDALDRQDPSTLRVIGEYAHQLAGHRERVPQEVAESHVAEDETLTGVIQAHSGTIVTKKVPCGKDSCTQCPHGPYKYRIYRDGDSYTTEYLGPVNSD